MQYSAVRTLQKNGNSYTVAIPRAFLMQLALFRGEEIRLVFDDVSEDITLRRVNPRPKAISAGHSARAVRPVL